MGYTVEVQGTEVIMGLCGQADHANLGRSDISEGKGGDNWHFGGNSTFILDGTKVRCDTEPIATDFWVVVAVDVTLGSSRFHYTKKGGASMHDDGREFDGPPPTPTTVVTLESSRWRPTASGPSWDVMAASTTSWTRAGRARPRRGRGPARSS